MAFFSFDDALAAQQVGVVDLHAKIKVRDEDGSIIDTTPGRIIFNQAIRQALQQTA
jgi:DNA-directed RNA polymerase subunit beta'